MKKMYVVFLRVMKVLLMNLLKKVVLLAIKKLTILMSLRNQTLPTHLKVGIIALMISLGQKVVLFEVGDKVKWNDVNLDEFPEEDRETQKNRIYTIIEIKKNKLLGDEYLIADDYGEVEVFGEELEYVPNP